MDDTSASVSSEPATSEDDALRYLGEDTRPTSQKEVAGWMSYAFAAEPFVICAVGSFIPITLEQLGREKGFLSSDHSKPCKGSASDILQSSSVVQPSSGVNVSHALYLVRRLLSQSSKSDSGQCVINFLGFEINTASFAMYTFSLSVLVQAILIISMSAVADHASSRKSLLLSFAFVGALATMLFILVIPDVYYIGALLAVISNTCFGASFVLLNSFLPIIIRRHPSLLPSVQHPAKAPSSPLAELDRVDDEADATEALLSAAQSPSDLCHDPRVSSNESTTALELSTKLSSYGIGIGYMAAVVVQTLAIALLLMLQRTTTSTTLPLRVALAFIGLWWLLFTIPSALWLRPRPGPPLSSSAGHGSSENWYNYIVYAWTSLWRTMLQARKLKDMMIFLAAWFLLSDSIATISGTAVLFAKTDLGMKPPALALISLIGTIVGVLGAFTWRHISRFFHLKPTQTIIACICIFEIIPLYGLLGFLPVVQRQGVLGLQQPWEMYPLGAIYGFVLGGLSSYCRSLFGELIPPGSEAAFYALYAITDKGSSVFGPAVVGAITDRYGEIRPAFVFLTVLIFLPLPLMLLVDVDRGKRQAGLVAVVHGSDRETRSDIDRID